jgi:hypothetical protein
MRACLEPYARLGFPGAFARWAQAFVSPTVCPLMLLVSFLQYRLCALSLGLCSSSSSERAYPLKPRNDTQL